MGTQNKDYYEIPFDVRQVAKMYSVYNKNFSKALIKIRYDRMDDATQRRAEKTLLSLQDGRYWK